MAELLYRIGRWCSTHAWRVLAAWLVALIAAGAAYAGFGGALASSVTIPGTPTAKVTDRLEQGLPGAAGGTARIVFHTTDGAAFTAEQQAAVSAAIARAGEASGIEAMVDPFATEAERTTRTEQVTEGRTQLDEARRQIDAGQAQLDEARAQAEAAGLLAQVADQLDAQQAQLDKGAAELEATGAQLEAGAALLDMAAGIRTVSEDGSTAVATVVFDLPLLEVPHETKTAVGDAVRAEQIPGVAVELSSELVRQMPGAGPGEVLGLVVAAVALVVMLGTLVAAGLPLLVAILGVGVSALGALAFSGTVEMMAVTPMLGVMLGLAVGIDYSLFIINRHRRELRLGLELHESVGLANGTSGNAVVFAGSTVLVALLALNLTGIPFLGLMGTVAAVSVAMAVLVAVTLTPALLGLIGRRVLPRRQRQAEPDHSVLETPAPMSTPRAALRLVIGVAVLLVVAIPALGMRLALPDGSSEPTDSTQYKAFTAIARAFGAGANGPLVVVADLAEPVTGDAVTATEIAVGQLLMAQEDVAAVAPVGASDDGTMIAFQVLPANGPTTESTTQLVHHLRALDASDLGVELGVAGTASGNIDISAKLADALPLYLAVVIGISLLILVLVFRSILVPLIATGGFILSVFASFGAVVAIYQWGWLGSVFGVHDAGPVLNFLPTILVGVLFGLAMDYQLFLVSGMREAYVHGMPARPAVVQGLRAGRAVVTAAGIIMISVFGGFVFADMAMIRPIGFGLAFGVLADAFVVRMVLVPAVMHLAGDKAWWLPRWLDRLLPDVDVEGASLERRHHTLADDATESPTPR